MEGSNGWERPNGTSSSSSQSSELSRKILSSGSSDPSRSPLSFTMSSSSLTNKQGLPDLEFQGSASYMSQPSSGASTLMGMPQYSAAALLNPRGYSMSQAPQQQQQVQKPKPNFSFNAPGQQQQPQQTFSFDSPSSHSSQPSQYNSPLHAHPSLPSQPQYNGNGNGNGSGNVGNGYQGFSGYSGYGGFGSNGLGQLLERQHGVVDRSAVPQKRQKTHDDRADDKKTATFNSVGNGGLGAYIKKQQQEGRKTGSTSGPAVDLTADDEDEIQVINNVEDTEVCYGRIEGAYINAHQIPTHRPSVTAIAPNMWPFVNINLRRLVADNNQSTVIYAVDATRGTIGCLDVKTSLGLAPLMDSSKLQFRPTGRILARPMKPDDLPPGTNGVSERYNLDLNVYGPRKYAQVVGKHLSQKQLWLRSPLMPEKGKQIVNPQELQRPAAPAYARPQYPVYRPQAPMRTTEEIRADVLGMFDNLERSENLPEMQADPRVTTELLRHQKQGLYFMTSKEQDRVYGNDEKSSSLWKLDRDNKGRQCYYNVITQQTEYQCPAQVHGGILADMMGLGKTLSILSLVVHTQAESLQWAQLAPCAPERRIQPEGKKGKKASLPVCDLTRLVQNVKTTLLVSPLSTIANWEEQIKQHIQPGTLKYYIYHGTSRIRDIQKLASYDLVITTYGSIATEFGHRSKKKEGTYPLEEINWFRIVLDEAHMIREQTTQQSRAICRLSAQRRWAVTGTPVQNRLEDLGALLAFLRIKPFDEKGGFAQWIMAPFKSCDPDILPKLRLLVDSITLRRLKDRIDLPPRTDSIVRLDFNHEEQKVYEIFAQNAKDKVSVIAGQREKQLGGKSYVHILQSILRLRLICAHGKDLLNEEDMKVMNGLSKDSAIELDDEDDQKARGLAAIQAYDMYSLMKETNADACGTCLRKIGPSDTVDGDSEPKDEIIGHMTSCYHIICNVCVDKFKADLQENAYNDAEALCVTCQQITSLTLFPLRQGGVEDEQESKNKLKDGKKRGKDIKCYTGPHTKTKALLSDLLASKDESERNPHEAPIKSVVFSGWTSHLDLIQRALEDNKITFTRLDGRMSRTARGAALDTFREDRSIHVIMVSIAAGGLGLNLTTANKIYVMEPQYNPAAEAQAVDRVHRLGQKRPVTTVRYIMAGSFEEKMLELQEKKKKLANMTLDSEGRGKMDKREAAQKRLEDLRSLFK